MHPAPRSILTLAAVALLAPVGPADAQAVSGSGGLRGTVVDAATGTALVGATVSLELLPGGVLAVTGPEATLLVTARQAVTGSDGAYRFSDLPPGEYRMRVVRIGYRSATLDLRYDGPADPRVSVGLVVSPVELEPVRVSARPSEPLAPRRGDPPPPEDERVILERLRQRRYPTPDARVLTDEDVLGAVTLGESDLLRALHRLPGVTFEDDWSAEPWTRGSRWDETRITFDGLPLLDPMHLGGAFTSVNSDAIGSLTFHPGVRPVALGDAAAGVVDLRTRRPRGEDGLTAIGQLTPLSARFSADRSWAPGSGLTVSGRRSLIQDLVEWGRDRPRPAGFPYRFTDLSGRFDQTLAEGVRVEVSGLRNRDRVFGDLPEELKGARGTWGNDALRATLDVVGDGLRARLTRGRSDFSAHVHQVPFDTARADLFDAATAAETENDVETDVTEITLFDRPADGRPPGWEVGLRRTQTLVRYGGPAPWPFPDAANAGRLSLATSVDRWASWGQVRRALAPDLELAAGTRLESAGRGAAPSLAPRIALTWTPSTDLRVSAALGRHHQYEQALATTGFTMGSGLGPGHLWVSAVGDIPVIRADLVTLGAELWLPGGWLAAANAYLRDSRGRLTPSPDSGDVRARPPVEALSPGVGWVAGEDRAVGLELSARRLAGRWTGSVSYAISRARTTAEGVRYPTPGARTHVLDAAVVARVGAHTRVGAALTAATGASYTRFYAYRCTDVTWYCPTADDGGPPVIGFVESAGAERTPAYLSVDVHAERSLRVFGLPAGLYLQLRNALGRDNRAAYVGSVLDCDGGPDDCPLTDRFEDGFPFLPLVGFWIRL